MTESEKLNTTTTNERNTNSTDKLLEVENLTTYFYTEFGVVKAVESVSFHIKEGAVKSAVAVLIIICPSTSLRTIVLYMFKLAP